jgi:hypothetical protein
LAPLGEASEEGLLHVTMSTSRTVGAIATMQLVVELANATIARGLVRYWPAAVALAEDVQTALGEEVDPRVTTWFARCLSGRPGPFDGTIVTEDGLEITPLRPPRGRK